MEYFIGAAVGVMFWIIIGVRRYLPKKQYPRRCDTCQWFGTSGGFDSVFRCYNPDSFRYDSFVCKPDYCKHWEGRS